MVRHSSRIELSQSLLKGNINFLRKKIGKDVRLSSVVKANAYGHGITDYVPMAEKCGIDHFSVASSFEAEEVLQVCKPETRIMIMGILYNEDIPWAIENGIEFYVFNFERLPRVIESAKELGKKARIHLEVETGANRTGLTKADFGKCLTLLKKELKHLEFEGLCTHFGGAETFANDFKIQKQYDEFMDFYRLCEKRKVMPKMRHLSSSAAALSFAKARCEMVRIGVAQYGFWPSPDVYYHHLSETGKTNEKGLKRIFTWKTDVMDVREVKEGNFIGYGTAYQATQDIRIAVLPLGYSNGYPRGLSNRGHVLIKGKKAPIVGLINMNLFMVDISHIEGVEPGEEVVLVGRQGNNVIGVASFTETTQLRNQEMMSRLPSAIPRKAVR
jgi:alanine racemase